MFSKNINKGEDKMDLYQEMHMRDLREVYPEAKNIQDIFNGLQKEYAPGIKPKLTNSKTILKVQFVDGLCVYATFTFNIRTKIFKRIN